METNNAGPAPVTGADWSGLPVAVCTGSGRVSRTDMHLPSAWLVLHELSGAEMEVRRGPFRWKFSARAGNFDFYPAGSYDEVASDPAPRRTILLTIPRCFERRVLDECGRAEVVVPRFQFRDNRLLRMVGAVVEQAERGETGDDDKALSLAIADRVNELVGPRPARAGAPVLSPLLRRLVLDHVHRYLSAAVDVDGVARLTGLARTQFAGAFRQAFGKPLHQYVMHARIDIAKQQLLNSNASLTQVALQLGFANHAHFTTVFKERVGVTPSLYREQHGGQAVHVTH